MSRKSLVLNSRLENVYPRDIVSRYGLHNGENIGDFLDVLASGLSTLVNPHKLANAFQSLKNASIAPHTIASSIKHLEEAFLICCAGRYDVKGKRYINTPFKIYFEDVGLRNARLYFQQVEINYIMENIIDNEPRYCGIDVDFVDVYENDIDARKNENVKSISSQIWEVRDISFNPPTRLIAKARKCKRQRLSTR